MFPQVAPQQTQQVDHIARPVTLLRPGPASPSVKQALQAELCSGFGVLSTQPLQNRCADQSFLGLAHVLFRLRPDQRLFNEQRPAGHARSRQQRSRPTDRSRTRAPSIAA